VVQRIQHAHRGSGDGDRYQKRNHDPRQLHRELELAGHRGEVVRVQIDERPRREHAGKRDRAGDDQQRVEHVVAEPPRGLLALQRQHARERRHEGGAHRAFGEQIAHQIGKAEGDDERVHVVAGAEGRGEHLIASQPEQTAGERRQAGESRVARERLARALVLFGSGQAVRFHHKKSPRRFCDEG
jgi:hypothetical protein